MVHRTHGRYDNSTIVRGATSDWLDAPRLVTHLFQNVKHIESLPKGGVPEGSP